jgi:hypothetical protein
MSAWLYLTGCTGYRVETDDGRVGHVAAVLPRTERNEPGVVIRQSGLASCGLMLVPLTKIEEVDHAEGRLLLRDGVPMPEEKAPTDARARALARA